MLNVNDLENRHKKYKRSSKFPYMVLLMVTGTAVVAAAFFMLFYKKNEVAINEDESQKIVLSKSTSVEPPVAAEEKNETMTVAPQKPAESKEIIASTPEIEKEPEVKENEQRVILSPSLDFMSKIESSSLRSSPSEIIPNTKKEEMLIEEAKPVVIPKKIEQIKEETVEPLKTEKIESVVPKEDKKSSISIERRDEQKDIADVIKRFNVNHNPALSLFVAKKYYQLGDYEQAYNYALMTNDLNNNIEESWIIFAKSLAKMNKKDLAVETLKKYISYSSSSQAKQLLDEISSGKFK